MPHKGAWRCMTSCPISFFYLIGVIFLLFIDQSHCLVCNCNSSLQDYFMHMKNSILGIGKNVHNFGNFGMFLEFEVPVETFLWEHYGFQTLTYNFHTPQILHTFWDILAQCRPMLSCWVYRGLYFDWRFYRFYRFIRGR